MPNLNEIKGKGVFFYPPIAITDDGVSNTLEPSPKHKRRKIVLNFTLSDDIRILVTDDGFLCPITKKNDEEMQEFLNTIFATFTTKFTMSQMMVKEDFGYFTWIEGSDFVDIGYTKYGSLRNYFESERDDEFEF